MPADDYTPSERDVREVWVDDRISRDPSRYPHGEAHVPELEREFDRFIARVRAEAGAQTLRDAADDMGTWADEGTVVTGDVEDEDSWIEHSVGEWLRARADTITQEDTP